MEEINIKLSELLQLKCPICGSTNIKSETRMNNTHLFLGSVFAILDTQCKDCQHCRTELIPFNTLEDRCYPKSLERNYKFNKNSDCSDNELEAINKFQKYIEEYMEMNEYDGSKEYRLKAFKYAVDKSSININFKYDL